MNEPTRLRHGTGPARQLMEGATLSVPSASRRRALAFTAAAANLAASGTVMAASGASLVKGVALWVSLGVVGGGLASLTVHSAITRWEAPRGAPAASAAARRSLPPSTTGQKAVPVAEPIAAALPPVNEPEPNAEEAQPPAAARSAGSAPSRSVTARPSLFEEQRVIESARAALARNDASRALELLNSYGRTFPRGQFEPEALALRVEALRSRGELERASTLAKDFAKRYPHHPLSSRVEGTDR